jgi:RecQ family ATP-dependent DNA helicase
LDIKKHLISKVNSFIEKEKKKSKKKREIIILKGFPNYIYEELCKTTKWIGSKETLNEKGYIDVVNLENHKKEIQLNFINAEELQWGFYEEFILLADLFNDIKNQFDGNIKIIDNNIFEKYYPLEVDNNYLNELCQVIDKEDLEISKTMSILIKYYDNCIKLKNSTFGVSFINKHTDEGIEIVPLFEGSENYNNSNDIDFDISSVAKDSEIFLLKNRILSGEIIDKINIVYDTEKEKQSVSAFITLLQEIGISFNVVINDRFREIDKVDDKKYLSILKKHWNSDCFRKLKFYENPDISNKTIEISQGAIISDIISQSEKTLKGDDDFSDIFITAPTGSGKSLLFHIPAIYLEQKYKAITIVITPLIALMNDQVEQLTKDHNVKCVTFINSNITPDEKEKRISKIKDGEFSIVYLSPELFLANNIESLFGDRKIGLVVVDEAHLVTTWGRDFRVDYWFLGGYIDKIRKNVKFPIVCLTATAVYMGTEDMVNDTVESLNLIKPKMYLGNVRRENIDFEINYISRRNIQGGFEDFKKAKTTEVLEKFVDEKTKALCYCPYTSQVEELFNAISLDKQCNIGKYYGTYDKYEKNEAYNRFKAGDLDVMICTKAFGMGVDINNIEKVYHFAPTGNLSDYIQEIGRTAREPSITGKAMTDYTDSDLKYVRMLYGLSSIKQYQLKEMIRKLYILYQEKGHRNMLISPEVFSYIFYKDDIENKVKSGLLLISKDLEQKYAFNVLIIRPKSMFTKNFVNVPIEIEKEFLNLYGEFCKKIDNDEPRVVLSNNRFGGNTIVRNSGTIFEVNMAQLWEKYFTNLTFAQFKKSFFDGDLFMFSDEQKLTPRLHFTLSFLEDFVMVQEKLRDNIDNLVRVFAELKNTHQFFTKSDFKETFVRIFGRELRNKELPSIILDLFVADIKRNIGFNQSADRWKFVQERKTQNREELVYRIMNSYFSGLSGYFSRLLMQCQTMNGDKVYSTYIAISNNGKKPDLIFLAVILEIFGLASYEVLGGKNTEIFVRINDPAKLRRLSNTSYSNLILSDIEKKRKKSQEVLSEFMRTKLSNNDRWDIIENYFLGKEDEVDLIFKKK